ncbi:MAG: DUF190 domain-containing protein [bacterium]|nr:DUF190 domain-containing protein [bacterium]
MKIEGDGKLLRILVGENDRWEGKPLWEAIILTARELGLAGATAVRGIAGYGANSRIHTTKVLRLSEDLPVLIEIVDKAERIDTIIPHLDRMVEEGLITTEKAHIIAYRHKTEE